MALRHFGKINSLSLFRMPPLPNCCVSSSNIISLDIHRKQYLEDHKVTQVRMDASKSPSSSSCSKQVAQGFVQSGLETLKDGERLLHSLPRQAVWRPDRSYDEKLFHPL